MVIAAANASGVESELYTNLKLPSSCTVAVIVYVVQLVLLLQFTSAIVIAASVNASEPAAVSAPVPDVVTEEGVVLPAAVTVIVITLSFLKGWAASGSAA